MLFIIVAAKLRKANLSAFIIKLVVGVYRALQLQAGKILFKN
jgi:hypothetical protein